MSSFHFMDVIKFVQQPANLFSFGVCFSWILFFFFTLEIMWTNQFALIFFTCFHSFIVYLLGVCVNFHRRFRYRNIPGPTPWPLFGNYFESEASGGSHYYQYNLIRQYANMKSSKNVSQTGGNKPDLPCSVIVYFRFVTPVFVVVDLNLGHSMMNRRQEDFPNRINEKKRKHFLVPKLITPPILLGVGKSWKQIKQNFLQLFQKTQIKNANRIPTRERTAEECIKEMQILNPKSTLENISLYEWQHGTTLRDSVVNIWGHDVFEIASNSANDMPLETICHVTRTLPKRTIPFTRYLLSSVDMGWWAVLAYWIYFIPKLRSVVRSSKLLEKFRKLLHTERKIPPASTSGECEWPSWNGTNEFPVPYLRTAEECENKYRKSSTDIEFPLPQTYLRTQCTEFLFATVDTVATTISGALYHLSTDISRQNKLRNELIEASKTLPTNQTLYSAILEDGICTDSQKKSLFPYLTSVLYESLRLYAPGVTVRFSVKPTKVIGKNNCNVIIEAGVEYQIPMWAWHHSEELWEDDPFTFQPERFLNNNTVDFPSTVDSDSFFETNNNPASYSNNNLSVPLSPMNVLSPKSPKSPKSPNNKDKKEYICYGKSVSENLVKACRWMPFGSGPRKCLGENYAVATMKVKLAEIIKNFQIESLQNKAISEKNIGQNIQSDTVFDVINQRVKPNGLWILEDGVAWSPKDDIKIRLKPIVTEAGVNSPAAQA